MTGVISFLKDERGASAVEYALLLFLLGSGMSIGVFALGVAIKTEM